MTNTFHDNSYNRPNTNLICSFHQQETALAAAPDNEDTRETCTIANLDDADLTENAQHTNCKPTPSHRRQRQRFTFGCTALTIGLLICAFSLPNRNEIIVPGGLSSNHGQILAPEGTKRCASCHGNAERSFVGWATDLVTGKTHVGTPQSELCLKCHQELSGPNALLAHNISPELLTEVQKRHQESASSKSPFRLASHPRVHQAGTEMGCAKCHQEHHGSQHNLAAMTDAQCQSCHQQKFKSFANGHPPIRTMLNGQRRSRIAFDHTSHLGKHFPSKGQAFNCAQCHVDDNYQDVKSLAPFEQSCASCHDQSIQESSSRLTLLSLPMLDVDAFKNVGADVGSWPEACQGDNDGAVPPIAQILLAANPKASTALQKLGDNFDFCDLDIDDKEQLKNAQTVVLELKAVLKEIALDGNEAIENRLSKISHDSTASVAAKALAIQLDQPAVKAAILSWFPDFNATTKPSLGLTSPPQNAFQLASSVRFNDDDLLAENPLKKLMPPNVVQKPPAQDNLDSKTRDANPSPNSPIAENQNQIIVDVPRKNLTSPRIENVTKADDAKIPGKVSNPFSKPLTPATDGELLADNPLKSLRRNKQPRQPDGSQRIVNPTQQPIVQSPNTTREPALHAPPNTSVAGQGNGKNSIPGTHTQPKLDGELLAENPLKSLKNRQVTTPPQNKTTPKPKSQGNPSTTNSAPEKIVQQTQGKDQQSSKTDSTLPRIKTNSQNKVADRTPVDLQATDRSTAELFRKFLAEQQGKGKGNWVVNHQTFSISYQPAGHADRLLQSMMTVAAELHDCEAARPLFEAVATPTSQGLCASCHTIDKQADTPSLLVNWKAVYRDPMIRGFTKFSHRPHLIQPQTSDCVACHQLDTTTNIQQNFVGFESQVDRGNFLPLTMESCISCHQKGKAANRCTTCHNYHIGSRVKSNVATPAHK